MHFVSRGPEPSGLKPIRLRFTQAWIDYYKNGIGNRPTDKRWRDFVDELRIRFNGCCGYCEMCCHGEVDHYRLVNKFPQLVYEWDNWVFSCHDCNHSKWAHWPPSGFLDPCSTNTFCDGPHCFIFDLKTGEVLPCPKLSPANRKRAQATINILRLNLSFRLKVRLEHIRSLETLINLAEYDPRRAVEDLAYLALPSAPLHSLTKYYLEELTGDLMGANSSPATFE